MLYEELVFEGLDIYCIVWFNGGKLFDLDNMFVFCCVDVGIWLKFGVNELLICFELFLVCVCEFEVVYGKCVLWNGDSVCLYVCKV